MKCIYSVLEDGIVVSSVSISKDLIVVFEDNQEHSFSISLNDGINTLVSLFSLKSKWSAKACKCPLYQIKFDDCEDIAIYNFDNDTIPDNWHLFNEYVNKLVRNVL